MESRNRYYKHHVFYVLQNFRFKLQKIKKFSLWINNVFRMGWDNNQRDIWNMYNNKINNTRHMSHDMYSDYKMKLLSLAVIAEYRDYYDTTGERKNKIYTCYKNNGTVENDLLVLINYILQYFYNNNQFISFTLKRQQEIKQQNQRIMNYKKYFELKDQILIDVSYGMTSGINYSAADLRAFIAQTYDRTDHRTEEKLHSVLTELDTQRHIQYIMNL